MGKTKKIDLEKFDPVQLRRAGVEALSKALGPVGMARFLSFYELGVGDYTKERKELLGEPTIEEVIAEIEKMHKSKRRKKSS